MKKIVLSSLAALTLGSVVANANEIKLYQDANGQVWTKAGEGRTELKSKKTSIFAHADKLKFSGQAFIGFTANDYKDGQIRDVTNPSIGANGVPAKYEKDKNAFNIRRGYFQLKAYLMDDPKSYYRVTFDVKQKDDGYDGDSIMVRTKYAYVNLNEVLPATSLEIGLAHRPWHDYEEHNSWLYRSISEILVEDHNGAHLSNSADLGVMAKTRTKFFDADVGVFNGEGYHELQNDGDGLSLEWRFTGHLLGTHGKPTKTTYLDASFYGQYNVKHYEDTDTSGNKHWDDLRFYGLHAVYNMPSFLIAAQYITSDNTASNSTYTSKGAGNGYGANAEVRLGSEKQYKMLARYDSWTPDKKESSDEYEQRTYIVGAAWTQNRNIEWVANATITDNEKGKNDTTASDREAYNGVAYMITAEIKF